jgi:hypothetical protein
MAFSFEFRLNSQTQSPSSVHISFGVPSQTERDWNHGVPKIREDKMVFIPHSRKTTEGRFFEVLVDFVQKFFNKNVYLIDLVHFKSFRYNSIYNFIYNLYFFNKKVYLVDLKRFRSTPRPPPT